PTIVIDVGREKGAEDLTECYKHYPTTPALQLPRVVGRGHDGQATRAVVRPGDGHGEDGPGLGQEAHGRGGPTILRQMIRGRTACGKRRPRRRRSRGCSGGRPSSSGGGRARGKSEKVKSERVKSENAEPNNVPTEAVEEEADEMTYAPYRPSKLRYGLAHPDPVVENATLAAVEPPDVTYNLALPADIISNGRRRRRGCGDCRGIARPARRDARGGDCPGRGLSRGGAGRLFLGARYCPASRRGSDQSGPCPKSQADEEAHNNQLTAKTPLRN
ncbi:hypothetical protein THAOC_12394, partial [Thalassiosira oceanica]